MKMKQLTFVTCMVLSTFLANAANINIEWSNSDNYRDIRAANGTQERFKQQTFKSLEKHLTKLAEKLPEEYLFKLKMTDLDLAGNVEYGHTQSIRVVRQASIPRIAFEYQLINSASQAVITSDVVKLKDMNFLGRINRNKYRGSYSYEKLMLNEWFSDTMKDYISN